MASSRRIGKWVLFGVICVVAVVVLLRVGAGFYLNSSAGRSAVGNRLQGMIGLPVHVSDVDIGSRSSSISFHVLDPKVDPAQPGAVILSVDSAVADASLTSLALGHSPKELTLHGVHFQLRLDADGNLLTTMPSQPSEGSAQNPAGELPEITMDNGQLTVRQEGRPPFEFRNVTLHAAPAGNKTAISGAADDPNWGKWKIAGELTSGSETGWLEVSADNIHATPERLRSLPAVPAAVWNNAAPAGRFTLTARVAIGPQKRVSYDARLRSLGASLTLPTAEVTLGEIAGEVHLHDGVAELEGAKENTPVTAKLAGGTVEVHAKWDFRKNPSIGDPIAVSAYHLAVKDLPEKWGLKTLGGNLPGKISLESGLLSGSANLRLVAYADGRLETYGGGSGRIDLPDIFGGKGSIGVKLGGNGQKLEFSHAPSPPPQPPMKKAQGNQRPITSERELFALLAILAVQPKADAKTSATDINATITLRDIDVAQFIEQLQLKLPYKLAGKVTVQAQFGVPLTEATSTSSYQLTGTLTSPLLQFEGLTIRDLTTQVVYKNNTLTLTALKGKIPQLGDEKAAPGTFSGTASASMKSGGTVSAKLALERIPAAQVAAALPGFSLALSGLIDGKAEFHAPYDTLSDPSSWNGSASLHSASLSVAGRRLADLSLGASITKGTLTLTNTGVTVEGIPIKADGTLALTGNYQFNATVQTTGTSVTDLSKLMPGAALPAVEGKLDTESKVAGTLSPLAFTASGHLAASKLTLGKTTANHIDVKWQVDEKRLKLSELTANLFGGTLSGSLDYPFNPANAGDFSLAFKNVDASAAAAFVPDFPIKVTGSLSGKVSGDIPAAKDGMSRIGNLNVDVTAPKLTVQNIPAERLVGKAAIKNGAIDYSLEGKTLGGSFEVKGQYPGTAKKEAAPKGPRGSLRINDFNLARLAPELKLRSLAPLRGLLNVTFDFDNDLSAGSGRISVRGFGWGKNEVAQDIDGVILLEEGFLEVRDLSGTIAGGLLRARARVNFKNPARNFVMLTIDRANAELLLAPIPDLKGISGDASISLRSTLGRTMHGSGTFTLSHGSVGGASIGELRVPFDFATAPGGSGSIAIREATTRAGTGRATASAHVDWGTGAGARVSGEARFIDVPLRALSSSLKGNSFLGNGKLTGRFVLAGNNVRTVDDLRGTLVATLNNTSVREIPLLQQTVPYLNPLGATKPFQAGDVRGTLSGGIFRIQRLALANPTAQIFAEGTVRTTGTLDLDVVAHTGQIGPNAGGLGLLGLRLPAVGPIPLSLITQVGAALSNRTIRLSITGNVSNPIVRINTGALLTESAVRFFLTRYVLPAQATEALGLGGAGALIGGTTGSMSR
jgi:translocation and assembly module TamB